MKHLFLLFFMMVCVTMNAQKDVTTFLGIPVDGTETELKQKIIQKGFLPKTVGNESFLVGEFNGIKSRIYFGTNNSKVFRVMVCDDGDYSEADIKIRFNNLVGQFKKNKRYAPSSDFSISEEEDISYGMSILSKTYDAIFFQMPNIEKIDTLDMQNKVRNELLLKYTEDQLQNPTEEVKKEANEIAEKLAFDLLARKRVWFRIFQSSSYRKYYLCIYYDNEYNRVDGEDL